MIYGDGRNLNAVIIASVTEAPKHIDGIGIKETQINNDGHLLITYTDDRVVDVGEVVGADAIAPIVNAWLDDHPEATTTVEDGSITEAKIAPLFLPEIKTTIDSTLSQSGAAAEAEAVGDEVNRLDGRINKTVQTEAQTLTAEQQAQALANLGLGKNTADVQIVRLSAGSTLTLTSSAATAILWNTTNTALIVGFRNNVASRILEGSGASQIATAASGTTYTIVNNSSAYLRGFIIADPT